MIRDVVEQASLTTVVASMHGSCRPAKTAAIPSHRGFAAFLAERRGALAPVVAVFMPLAFGAAGAAIDVSNSYVEQNRLQTAVDEATLVAARLLPDVEAARAAAVKAFDDHYNIELAERKDELGLDQDRVQPTDITFGRWDPETRQVIAVDADEAPPNTIALTVERHAANGQGLDTWFLAAFGIEQLDLEASAVARTEGGDGTGLCILALEPVAGEAVSVVGTADIGAPDCRIQVNSTAGDAIDARGVASITAAEICVVGGVRTRGPAELQPWPETGCAAVLDPLADFAPPAIGTCDHFGRKVSGAATLEPGVYCGGLEITGSGAITLAPGIFVIKDGPLRVSGGGKLTGNGVAFHLAGNNARLHITGSTEIDIKAPTSGPLAGFAVYQNPDVPAGLESFGAGAAKARYEGTIYLPSQHLRWAGTPATTLPPWTLMIARTLSIFGTGQLRIENDFAASDVPPPEELNQKPKVRLVN